jgi:hypothetical protein
MHHHHTTNIHMIYITSILIIIHLYVLGSDRHHCPSEPLLLSSLFMPEVRLLRYYKQGQVQLQCASDG